MESVEPGIGIKPEPGEFFRHVGTHGIYLAIRRIPNHAGYAETWPDIEAVDFSSCLGHVYNVGKINVVVFQSVEFVQTDIMLPPEDMKLGTTFMTAAEVLVKTAHGYVTIDGDFRHELEGARFEHSQYPVLDVKMSDPR